MNDTVLTGGHKSKTVNILVAALGGEGGGVFTNWLIDVAEANHWICQTTSLAGVAQRTGATIYYIELFPRNQLGKGKQPVMSLFPSQGDIDIAITSEIAEAGRMLQRGFITPDRTTLISSTHRVYGISEKSALGDGAIDPGTISRLAAKYARHFVCYDMLALAKRHNSVISSALLGGLAGSGALAFSKDSFEQVIRATGKAVESNLAAFEASYQEAATSVKHSKNNAVEQFDPQRSSLEQNAETAFSLPAGATEAGRLILQRLKTEFPGNVHEIAYYGLLKTLEYQDHRYGCQYLDELAKFIALDAGENGHELLRTIGRYLALWMCFEDIPRVAQLKIRATRMAEIREEVQAEPDQFFYVTEFFKPRVEEMCAIMPAGFGKLILNNKTCYSFLDLFSGGRKLKTNTLAVYFSLRFLASLRRFRRGTLGYKHEHEMIKAWLNAIESLARKDSKAALELAECGRLVKGYGKTRERTTTQLMCIVDLLHNTEVSARNIAQLRDAALAGDDNRAFLSFLATLS